LSSKLEWITRPVRIPHDRAALLAESLLFALLNLQPSTPSRARSSRPNGRYVAAQPSLYGDATLTPCAGPGPRTRRSSRPAFLTLGARATVAAHANAVMTWQQNRPAGAAAVGTF